MNKSDKELFASYNAVYGTKISDNTGPSGSTQTLKQLSSNRCVFQKKNLKATV